MSWRFFGILSINAGRQARIFRLNQKKFVEINKLLKVPEAGLEPTYYIAINYIFRSQRSLRCFGILPTNAGRQARIIKLKKVC